MENISLIYQKNICPTPVITNRRSVVSTCYFLSRNQILTLLAAAATESVNSLHATTSLTNKQM